MLNAAPHDVAEFCDDPNAPSGGAVAAAGPAQIGLPWPVGSGKTKAIVERIARVFAGDATARAVVSVPDHSLAAEMQNRLRDGLGASVEVEIWRGQDQPDPAAPTLKMCRRGRDATAVREAGGDLSDLCGSAKRGFCPFHPDGGAIGGCGYVLQGRKAPRVWVLTHAILSRPAPVPLRRHVLDAAGCQVEIPAADFVAIDERFDPSMIHKKTVPVAMLDGTGWPVVPDRPGDISPGFADKRFRAALAGLQAVFTRAAHGDRVGKADLAAAGLTASDCRAAALFALRCKVDLPRRELPDASARTIPAILGTAAADNARVLAVDRLCKVGADVLDGNLGPAALRVVDGGAGRTILLHWREPIHWHWLEAHSGIMHADATMNVDIVRQWLPRIANLPAPAVAAPHMRIVQVTDRAVSYANFIAGGAWQSADGKKAAANNVQRLLRAIHRMAKDCAGKGAPGGHDVLSVLPKNLHKAFEAAAEADPSAALPTNVGILTFGKLRGQDAYKGVAALVIVSRPLPRPEAMEDLAEIVFGRGVTRLKPGEWYPTADRLRVMADGTRVLAKAVAHPDTAVEALRRAACEAEVIQAIGRGRGIHRTAANPLDAYVLTDVVLEGDPVAETITLDDFWRGFAAGDPVAEFERAGVLPMDWHGRGVALATLGSFKPAADPGDAARSWFRHHPDDFRRLAGLVSVATGGSEDANSGQTSIGDASIRGLPGVCASEPVAQPPYAPDPPPSAAPLTNPAAGAWTAYRYRLRGRRNAQTVFVSPAHTDPRTAAEDLLGTVDLFEPAPSARARPAATRRTTAAPQPIPGPVVPPPAAGPVVPVVIVAPAAPQEDDAAAMPVPLSAPVPPPPAAAPVAAVPAAAPATGPDILDTIPVGLPAVMSELEANGIISRATRHRHMDRFRRERGPFIDRERAAVARLAADVGPYVLSRAVRAAAARKLGLPVPVFTLGPRPDGAEAA